MQVYILKIIVVRVLIKGIGKSFTPEAFVNACEVFIYSDLLLDRSIPSETIASTSTFSVSTNHPTEIACEMSSLAVDVHDVGTLGSSAVTAVTPPRLISSCPMPSQPTPLPWDFVNQAFESSVDVTGKAHFSSLSNCFRKMDPLFDHRKFGFMSFRKLCETFSPDYEVIEAVRPSDGRLNFALVRKGAKQLVVLRDYDVNSDSRSAKKGRTY